MEIILAVIVGYILASVKDADVRKKMWDYFRTPSQDNIELDWFGRQLLQLFSIKASNRWYEARAHLYQNLLVSLGCAFGFVYIVQVSFSTDKDDTFCTAIKLFPGFGGLDTLMVKVTKDFDVFKKKIKHTTPGDVESIFVAGYNVVSGLGYEYQPRGVNT